MRKLAHIAAPPQVVAAMFQNLGRWTRWMPGVEALSVLEERPGSAVALIKQRLMGHGVGCKFGFVFGSDSIEQRQLEGPFRRWETRWRFVPPPDGSGCTVIVDIEFELGLLLGFVTPRRVLQDRIDRMFQEIMDKARARARAVVAGETLDSLQLPTPGIDALLAIDETDRGLEIELGHRRYFVPRARER